MADPVAEANTIMSNQKGSTGFPAELLAFYILLINLANKFTDS